jgi:hypothetical protein
MFRHFEEAAEEVERLSVINPTTDRRGFIGGLAAVLGITTAFGCASSGGGGHSKTNKSPVVTDIDFFVAKEGMPLSAGAVGSDPEGKPITFYKISSSLDDSQYGGLQVLVDPDGTVYTSGPLPYNSEGLQSIKIGARDPSGKTGEYEKVFNVEHALGPNDLPYEFDYTESAEPAGLIAGYNLTAWENIYFSNPDVVALFDNDINNDMNKTMANLIDTNPDNWEFQDPANAVFMTQDTIYYLVHNPETNLAEYKGEFIGTAGVDLIKSK